MLSFGGAVGCTSTVTLASLVLATGPCDRVSELKPTHFLGLATCGLGLIHFGKLRASLGKRHRYRARRVEETVDLEGLICSARPNAAATTNHHTAIHGRSRTAAINLHHQRTASMCKGSRAWGPEGPASRSSGEHFGHGSKFVTSNAFP